MNRQQHTRQMYLLPAANQVEDDVPVGLDRALAVQSLVALRNLQIREQQAREAQAWRN
jgi:hypothetical protein